MNRDALEKSSDDELLSAYLDGELEEVETNALRERLTNDELLRIRLVHLQKAWDLLDDLPQKLASPSFTQSTLELVVSKLEENEKVEPSRWGFAWKRWLVGVATIGFCCAIAFVAGSLILKYQFDQKLKKLDALIDYAGFHYLGSVKVAEKLLENEDFRELLEPAPMIARIPKETEVRKKWIAELDESSLFTLWNREQSIAQMPVARRTLLDSFSQSVQQSPESERLRNIMTCVANIMDARSPTERAMISDDEEARLEQLERFLYLELSNRFAKKIRSGMNVSEETLKNLRDFAVEGANLWNTLTELSVSNVPLQDYIAHTDETARRVLDGLSQVDQVYEFRDWIEASTGGINEDSPEESMFKAYEEMRHHNASRIDEVDLLNPEEVIKELNRHSLQKESRQ